MFSLSLLSVAAWASYFRLAAFVYRSISMGVACPVMAATSCGVHPYSAKRRPAASRNFKTACLVRMV